jgi:hypothetical protein
MMYTVINVNGSYSHIHINSDVDDVVDYADHTTLKVVAYRLTSNQVNAVYDRHIYFQQQLNEYGATDIDTRTWSYLTANEYNHSMG